MKIAIFENEYDSIKGAFESANLLDFNRGLILVNFPSSQSADFNTINEYQVIFIDIDLSSKSELDGFSLIEKIRSIDDTLTKRIVILTGNNKIEEILKERGIYSKTISIIIKPASYIEITNKIRKVLKA